MAPVIFAGVFGARFLDFKLDNDHFRMITQGRQVLLFGELPYRDFLDPGIFLQIFTSAALQGLSGDNLLGQALFDLTILGLAAVLTFHLAAQVARSTSIGLLTTILAVAMVPRLKQHQVIFLPVLGLLLCWRYLDRPSLPRLVALGLAGGLAFLVRHDQGVYLAVPALITLVAAHRRDGWRMLLRRCALCGATAFVTVAPFFVFLEANGGVVGYFRSASEYVESEADRQTPLRLRPFAFDASAPWFQVEPPPPRPPGHLQVRWKARVSPEQRAQLEQRYHLANPERVERPGGASYRYDVYDYSSDNLRALVRDGSVDRTFLINRDTYRLDREPSEPPLVSLWRAFPPFGFRPLPGIMQPANAIPWLFYVFLALPVLALLILAVRRPMAGGPAHEAPKVLAVALLCLAMLPSLRDPLSSRLADLAAPPAILGAWLLAGWLRMASPRPGADRPGRAVIQRSFAAVLAGILVVLTGLSAVKLPESQKHFAQLELVLSKADDLDDRVRQVMGTLQTPGARSVSGIDDDLLVLVRYVQACTRPTDRLLVTWFAPEAYFYARRGFAGRQIFWFSDFYASPEDQARSVASLRTHSVPIVLHQTNRQNSVTAFDDVQAYLAEHYRLVHRLATKNDGASTELHVLVDHRRDPTGTYDRLPLPCYA